VGHLGLSQRGQLGASPRASSLSLSGFWIKFAPPQTRANTSPHGTKARFVLTAGPLALVCSGSMHYTAKVHSPACELEVELIQTHMTQEPWLWVEVGALAVRKRSDCAGAVWAGADVAWRLCVCVVFEAFFPALRGRDQDIKTSKQASFITCSFLDTSQTRAWVFEALFGCLASSAFFVWCSPAGGCVQSTADF
jgi:hypothetical protein